MGNRKAGILAWGDTAWWDAWQSLVVSVSPIKETERGSRELEVAASCKAEFRKEWALQSESSSDLSLLIHHILILSAWRKGSPRESLLNTKLHACAVNSIKLQYRNNEVMSFQSSEDRETFELQPARAENLCWSLSMFNRDPEVFCLTSRVKLPLEKRLAQIYPIKIKT